MPDDQDTLPPRVPGEFIMSQGVPVSEAAMQFFVEALRANTKVLENVNSSMLLQQQELKEQLKLITDVRERVIRIEALPRVEKEIAELRGKVQVLEMSKAQADAKAATWTWIVRYLPALAGIVVTIIASVFIILVASGQLTPRQNTRPAPSQAEQVPTALGADGSSFPAPRPTAMR